MPRIRNRPRCWKSYDKVAAPIANRRAGSVTETLSRTPNDAGESALGDIIADAQLAATRAAANGGAVIAFTNPGGIRTDIAKKEDGAVTYADVFASQPFRNQLVTLTLTGRQIKDMLEQQWARSEAAADPAGLEGFQLHLGRRQAVWRPRDRRSDVAERTADRSRGELSRDGEQLSCRSAATASPC